MPQIDRALSMAEDMLLAQSDAALNALQCAEKLEALLCEGGHRTPEWIARLAEVKTFILPGIYEHHKSTEQEPKLYTVLGVGDNSEDGSVLVACIAHYAPRKGELGYRPLLSKGGFLLPLHKGRLMELQREYWVPRFKFLRPLPQSFEHFIELTTG